MTEKLPFEEIKREILVKRDARPSTRYGTNPEDRPTDELIQYGVVNIDKPSGPTSHQVSDYVQKILKIDKAGHSGTLDPKVTGVLPIATGRATRVVEYLLKAGKEYVGIMHLHKDVPEGKLHHTIQEFIGKINQLPPIKSAIKRQMRERSIYYFKIIEIDDKDVLFRVGCQAGTYIRKLAHDVGVKLEVGAHMSELRRTKAGPFDESTLVTLQDLSDAYHFYKEEGNGKFLRHCMQPVESAVRHLPKIYVMDSSVNSICHGSNLKLPGISKLDSGILPDDSVAVITLKKELIGVGIAKMDSEKILKEEKGIAVDVNKVFMLPDVYPKME